MHQFHVKLTIKIEVPGAEPVEVERWATVPASPTLDPVLVKLPNFVSRRGKAAIQVAGQLRVVPARVAILLDNLRAGTARCKPSVLRELLAAVPEVEGAVVRDVDRKSVGGMVPVRATRKLIT